MFPPPVFPGAASPQEVVRLTLSLVGDARVVALDRPTGNICLAFLANAVAGRVMENKMRDTGPLPYY